LVAVLAVKLMYESDCIDWTTEIIDAEFEKQLKRPFAFDASHSTHESPGVANPARSWQSIQSEDVPPSRTEPIAQLACKPGRFNTSGRLVRRPADAGTHGTAAATAMRSGTNFFMCAWLPRQIGGWPRVSR